MTGATGVLGRRVVRVLCEEGHELTAIARTDDKAAGVRAAGATPVRVSLFDLAELCRAMAGHDAVLNLATHIPPVSQAVKPSAWAESERIRTEGSTTVVDAALATGASILVQESLAFYYADHGARWVPPGSPLSGGAIAAAVQVAEANVRRFTGPGRRGVTLRFGRFYGPDSGYTRVQIRAGRFGISTELGVADGYQPVLHLDDAASAVVAALGAPPGVYDVVDDVPMTRREIDAALAAVLGVRRLRRLLDGLARRSPTGEALQRSMRVSNRVFREVTGWQPELPSVREGFAAVVRDLGVVEHRGAASDRAHP